MAFLKGVSTNENIFKISKLEKVKRGMEIRP